MKSNTKLRRLDQAVSFAVALLLGGFAAAQSNVVGWGSAAGFTPPSIEKTTQVAAGFNHSVTIQADGSVFAWGRNTEGQCSVPANLGPCAQIAAGESHTVALRNNREVVAWGANSFGQCTVPADLGRCVQIAAGFYHTVAIRADGTVRAWGYNGYGQCDTPADLGPCIKIAAGSYCTLALQANGRVRVWGSNTYGQCNVPVDLGPCTEIAAGSDHAVAIESNGTIRFWGSGNNGQFNIPPDLGPCVKISAGIYHTVAIQADGTARVWGANDYGQCNAPANLVHCTQIAAGAYHTVVVQSNGSIKAWGRSDYRQSIVPSQLETCSQIAAGSIHTIALQTNGSIRGWGYNYFGQCDPPASLSSSSQIAVGYFHTVALQTNGIVKAWGYNGYGQCNVPISLGACTAVAAGSNHTVALKSDGTVVAWGGGTTNTGSYPEYGQSIVPAGLGACTQIAAGYEHTLAIRANGTVAAWGHNDRGQCNIPPGLGACKAIAAGESHSVAIQTNGTVVAWGWSSYGQTTVPANLGACTAVAAGQNHSIALKENGSIAAWGLNNQFQCNVQAGTYSAIAAGGSATYGILDQGGNPCTTQSVAQSAGVGVNTSFWRYALAWSWPDGGVRVPGALSNVDLGDFGSIASDCAAQAGTFVSRSTSKMFVPIDCPGGSCPGLGAPAVSVIGQAKLGGTLQLQITGEFSGATLPADLPPIAVLQAGSIDPARNTFDVLITDPPPPSGMFATLIPETLGNGNTLYTLQLLPLSINANLTGSTGASANGAAIAVDAIDFNGDGFDDIALAIDLGPSSLIQVLLNDGLGNLGGTSVLKSIPASPTSLAVGSFDGDGLRNEIAVGLADGTVRVYHSNGVSLSNGTVITLSPGVVATAVCELPGSAAASEVAVGTSDETVNICNALSGTVTHTANVAGTPGVIKAGNLDGVKGKDLATGGNAANSFNNLLAGETGFVQIILATDTDYSVIAPMPLFGVPVAMQMADIDGDGLADIVTANADPLSGAPGSPPPVFGLFRNVAGAFSGIIPVAPAGSIGGLDVAMVDVNNDGTRDLVTVYETVGSASQAALVNINTFGAGFPLSIGATTIISSDNPTLVTKANLDGNASEDVFLVTQPSPFTLNGNSSVTPYLGAIGSGVFGDLDGDGFVDGADVGLLLLDFGPCQGCPSDLDGDGIVDGADMGLLLLSFS